MNMWHMKFTTIKEHFYGKTFISCRHSRKYARSQGIRERNRKNQAVLIEGEIGSEDPSPIRCEILSIPYNNQEAADIAEQYPDLPNSEAYRKEVLTGIYSR